MRQNCAPLSRSFSELPPYQNAYTLVYIMEEDRDGCTLTVCRTGGAPVQRSVRLSLSAEQGEIVQRFLWENGVGPEELRAIAVDLCPQAVQREGRAERA